MLNVCCRCGDTLELPEGMVGEPVDCPSCGKIVRAIAGPESNSFDDSAHPLLSIRNGPDRVGEQFALVGNAPIAVGKLPDHPLSLVGTRVSRLHCRLKPRGGRWHAEDNKSTNGLFVNGRRVTTSQPLGHGDVLTVGEFELEYHDPTHHVDQVGIPVEASDIDLDSIGESYDLAEEPVVAPAPAPPSQAERAAAAMARPDAISCPGCAIKYPKNSKICVNCGIDLKTGRAILVSSEIDENALHVYAEQILYVVSFVIRIGLYPLASEGFGSKKPYSIYGIAALTILITIAVWITEASSGPQATKNLMLWAGREPTAADVQYGYMINPITHWGDSAAMEKKLGGSGEQVVVSDEDDDETPVHLNKPYEKVSDEKLMKAYNELEPEQQCYGQFHAYQLFTNGFLHGGIMHLVGNLLFLMVFGSRVNALIGQWKTLALYPVLLLLASLTYLISEMGHSPRPAIGASGAIMGLAGMYLILFPLQRVHMAAWIRWRLLYGFGLKIFTIRGFWVVLFYIAFDVIATVFGAKDGTAHWAHLGGFIAGAVLALILLVARQIDAHGSDMISVLLGHRAWTILGKPKGAQIAVG